MKFWKSFIFVILVILFNAILLNVALELVNTASTPEVVAGIVLVVGIVAFWIHKIYEVLIKKGDEV